MQKLLKVLEVDLTRVVSVFTLSLLILSIFGSCKTKQTNKVPNYNYETLCLKNNDDGTVLLNVWGKGFSKSEARVDAQKNAVQFILFNGSLQSEEGCNMVPVLNNPYIKTAKEAYFIEFFSKSGGFHDYVNVEHEEKSFISSETSNNAKPYHICNYIVEVNRYKLKERMIQDQILK